jgi:NAD(P)-dependent dehydrogenase (short-subunit alcohol dehydrogenase family)
LGKQQASQIFSNPNWLVAQEKANMQEPQTVLITAGGSGIGRAMAEAFHASGYLVAITDVDKDALHAITQTLPDVMCFHADVCNEADMQALDTALHDSWNRLDVVMANAGIAGPTAALANVELADWQRCLAVNLDGAFLTCRIAAKWMSAQKQGVITLTSSTAGLFGYPFRSAYASAKWGIIGLMKTLAMELGPDGIRVNAICPGAVSGDRMDRVIANEARARGISKDKLRSGYADCVSLKSFVDANDVADMALYLASEKARMISGMAMAVDGHTEKVTL